MRTSVITIGIAALLAPVAVFASATSTASVGLAALRHSASEGAAYIRQLNGTSSTTPGITRSLRRGASGGEVELLQEFLKRYGVLAADAPTGHFGPKTTQAVIAFQIRENIDPIGIVGPQTRARIIGTSRHTLAALSQATSSAPMIDSAILTNDVGDDGSGVGSSTVFASTTRTIYAVIALSRAKTTSQIGYIRYRNGAYLDAKVAHPSRSRLRYLHFEWTLQSGATRTPGAYTITFYLDGVRGPTVSYTIQ